MKIKLLIITSLIVGASAVTINLNDVQNKNISQIQAVSESFGQLSTQNKADMQNADIESMQRLNKIQISQIKIGSGNMPRVDMATIKPNQIQVVDLVKNAQKSFNSDPHNTDISLFLSFTSMESEVVEQYVLQATKYHIPIVLRGFVKNSYKETSNYIRRLNVTFPELVVLIDPPAYEKFEITEVPTLVITKSVVTPLQNGCAAAGDYTKVSGLVSIQAMLDYIRRNSKNPQLVTAATERLNDVRQKSYFNIH